MPNLHAGVSHRTSCVERPASYRLTARLTVIRLMPSQPIQINALHAPAAKNSHIPSIVSFRRNPVRLVYVGIACLQTKPLHWQSECLERWQAKRIGISRLLRDFVVQNQILTGMPVHFDPLE